MIGASLNLQPLFLRSGLRGEQCDASVLGTRIHYFSPEERAACEIHVSNGRLLNCHGAPISTTEHPDLENMLIIDQHERCYCAVRDKTINSPVRHSSPTAGEPVWFAGNFKATEGCLDQLSNDSGHYFTTLEHLIIALRFFLDQGVDIGQTKVSLVAVPPTMQWIADETMMLSALQFLSTMGYDSGFNHNHEEAKPCSHHPKSSQTDL